MEHLDTIENLNNLAATEGDDWRLKILRRNTSTATPESVALFDGATLEHIVNPELWLPQLSGGGNQYIIQIYHAKTPHKQAGVITVAVPGQPKQADASVTTNSDWQGPTVILNPKLTQDSTAYIVGSPSNSHRTSAQAVTEKGERGATDYSIPEPAWRYEKEMILEKARMREEMKEKEMKLEFSRLEHKLAELSKPQAPPQGPDLALILEKISQREEAARLEMAKLQQENQRQAMEFQKMMFQILSEKPKVDPLMQLILEKKLNEDSSSAKILEPVMKSMQMMVQTQAAAMEMGLMGQKQQQEEDGNSGLMKAIGELAAGYISAQSSTPPSQQAIQSYTPPPVRLVRSTTPAPQQAVTTSTEAFNGVEEEQSSILDQLTQMIQEKQSVVETVDAFFKNLKNPEIQEALKAANGNPVMVFAPRLGDAWVSDAQNQAYIQELTAEVMRVFNERKAKVAAKKQSAIVETA